VLSDSIVNPRPLAKNVPSFCLYIPFDPFPSLLQAAIEKSASPGPWPRNDHVYTLSGGIILYRLVGAPAAVLWLERLIASGVQKILLLSFCGSLKPGLRIGQVVVLRQALADEGTSRHYFPRQRTFFPSPVLTGEVVQTLGHRGLPFSLAATVSTDAPYRETQTWLKKMRDRHIDVVDMEASAVFALARYRGIEAAGLTVVSDELFSGVWNDHFPPFLLRETIERYFFPFLDSLKTPRIPAEPKP